LIAKRERSARGEKFMGAAKGKKPAAQTVREGFSQLQRGSRNPLPGKNRTGLSYEKKLRRK